MAEPIVTVILNHNIVSEHPLCTSDPFTLGPLDQLVHTGVSINVVWFYESMTQDELVPLFKFRRAINRLLDFYPHLTGRLSIHPDSGTRTIRKLGTGMHLIEAKCDANLQKFREKSQRVGNELDIFSFPQSGDALLAPWDPSPEAVQRDPIFTIQHTRFACSAVAIGMRISHVVCDAGGFLQVYQDLAEIYRAIGTKTDLATVSLSVPPCLNSFMVDKMLHMDPKECDQALSKTPKHFFLATATESTSIWSQYDTSEPILGRSMNISSANLANLKAQAVALDGSTTFSSFCVLSAYLWQQTHIARLHRSNRLHSPTSSPYSKSAFLTSVNFSTQMGLPSHSFGNSIITPFAELTSDQLATRSISNTAQIIYELTQIGPTTEIKEQAKWIAAQPDKTLIRYSFPFSPSSFMTSGWHRFPLYQGAALDVEPVFVSPTFIPTFLVDGLVYFLKPRDGRDGLDMIMSLRESTWKELDQCDGFAKMFR